MKIGKRWKPFSGNNQAKPAPGPRFETLAQLTFNTYLAIKSKHIKSFVFLKALEEELVFLILFSTHVLFVFD